jgi:hypothetical protein
MFPVPFGVAQDKLSTWAQTSMMGNTPGSDYLWIQDGLVRGCYMRFYVDVSPSADRDTVTSLKSQWDNHLASYNLGASEYAKGALHTSQLWAWSDSQQALLSSLAATLAIASVLAFFSVLAFTRDPALSAMVLSSAVGAVASLAFFMTTVMDWPIGGIEVLALTVLTGFALDYPLHVVHRYGSDEAARHADESSDVRMQRVSYALASTGEAVLGSAATTALSAVLLLFCTLTVFVEIGAVVLVVTMLAIFAAMVAVPAVLLTFGPARPADVCLVIGGLLRRLRGLRGGGGRSRARGEQVPCGVAVETPGGQLTEPPPESENERAYWDEAPVSVEDDKPEAQSPEWRAAEDFDAEGWDPGPDSQAVAACPVDPTDWDPHDWEVSHEPSLPRRPSLSRI